MKHRNLINKAKHCLLCVYMISLKLNKKKKTCSQSQTTHCLTKSCSHLRINVVSKGSSSTFYLSVFHNKNRSRTSSCASWLTDCHLVQFRFGQGELTTIALGECISALSSLRSFSAWTKTKGGWWRGETGREMVSSAVSTHALRGKKN